MGKRNYKIDETYFEKIDTEDKAYFLGFLMADGNVGDRKNNMNFSLHIKEVDISILETFKKYLKSEHPIKKISRDNCVKLCVGSVKMVGDLIKHGCIPRKTFKLKFPHTIESELMNHFIRGYFDGDGSVYNRKKKNQKVFKIIGREEFVRKIQDILVENCDVNKNKIKTKGNVFEISYGGNASIIRIANYLYKDSTICLGRKRNIFYKICQ